MIYNFKNIPIEETLTVTYNYIVDKQNIFNA